MGHCGLWVYPRALDPVLLVKLVLLLQIGLRYTKLREWGWVKIIRLMDSRLLPFRTLAKILCQVFRSFSGKLQVYQTLRIWLGTQFSQPNPELGPLQAEF